MTDTRPTMAEITELCDGFVTRTLPAERFHHREHLIVTTFLRLGNHGDQVRRDLPDLIRHYNVACGGVNDDEHGYHHTITMAYLNLIEQVLDAIRHDDPEVAVAAVLASPAADRDVLLRYWSRDILFSVAARRGWVEPDIRALSLDPMPVQTGISGPQS